MTGASLLVLAHPVPRVVFRGQAERRGSLGVARQRRGFRVLRLLGAEAGELRDKVAELGVLCRSTAVGLGRAVEGSVERVPGTNANAWPQCINAGSASLARGEAVSRELF